jgi:hypothetical protein
MNAKYGDPIPPISEFLIEKPISNSNHARDDMSPQLAPIDINSPKEPHGEHSGVEARKVAQEVVVKTPLEDQQRSNDKSEGLTSLLQSLFTPTTEEEIAESAATIDTDAWEDMEDGEDDELSASQIGKLAAWRMVQSFWQRSKRSADLKIALLKQLGTVYYTWLMPTAMFKVSNSVY